MKNLKQYIVYQTEDVYRWVVAKQYEDGSSDVEDCWLSELNAREQCKELNDRWDKVKPCPKP